MNVLVAVAGRQGGTDAIAGATVSAGAPVSESEADSSRETALLELFSMGILTEQELEAELARAEEPESFGWLEVSSQG